MRTKLRHCWLIILCSCVLSVSVATATQNSWDVLRLQFKLNHQVTQPEVQHQLQWLVAHPSYINKLAQSEPYLYHLITEVKKRGLPGEIVLIPMIESSYDPFAYSGAGAAGLWQLMPGTGTDLGLKQDWWADSRRSIRPSTDAAMNYLLYLNHFFHGDWILAFAAYDSGEGTMARIIKASHQTGKSINFWTLPVPRETKAYIPRLLALAEVIQNPARYHVKLPAIPLVPYFQEVNIGSQIDLNHAAKLAGISYKKLLQLNPGFNHWATAPYRPYKLLIPTDRVQVFSRNLANLPEDQRVSWTRHQVSAGDNLVIIAQKYHTTVNLIKELNQLKSNSVKKGAYVLIPSTKNTVVVENYKTDIKKNIPTKIASKPSNYKLIHIVQKNETYAHLAKKYGVNKQQIIGWNHLRSEKNLRTGQQLVIWHNNLVKPTITAHNLAVTRQIQHGFNHLYTIRSGDTLQKIARQNHLSLKQIVRLNAGVNPRSLRPGRSIRLA